VNERVEFGEPAGMPKALAAVISSKWDCAAQVRRQRWIDRVTFTFTAVSISLFCISTQ